MSTKTTPFSGYFCVYFFRLYVLQKLATNWLCEWEAWLSDLFSDRWVKANGYKIPPCFSSFLENRFFNCHNFLWLPVCVLDNKAFQKGVCSLAKAFPTGHSTWINVDQHWFNVITVGWMEGLRFYVFLTVFQSYHDDGRIIMNGCMQRNPVYGWEDFTSCII